MICKNKVVLISSCLLGVNCNYKGEASSAWQEGLDVFIARAVADGWFFLPVCPEQLGGLPSPRIPAELEASADKVFSGNGRIVNKSGQDVTDNFIKGAREALRLAEVYQAPYAILKSKSPSCGVHQVYDGSFAGRLIAGRGLTAELFAKAGIGLVDEKEILRKLAAEIDPLGEI
jgi:uncharacterized protein YbbK (DUF523 family)